MQNRIIRSVRAQQVYTKRTHPGIEAIVATCGGHIGRAVCTAGHSVGSHEVAFSYDGGERWHGFGVMGAVKNVEEKIAPAIIGIDAADQYAVDQAMLNLLPDAKAALGGNALAAVSAAALKAGAQSLGIPLYRHIGGQNACYLPVPGISAVNGDSRYGGGVTTPGNKPSYSFMMHGFGSFAEASYAGWVMTQRWTETMKAYGIGPADYYGMFTIPAGKFKSDEEIWALMAETIVKAGYENRIGIQIDVASDTYYDRKEKLYKGLFSAQPKTQEDMLALYEYAVAHYPIIILEDPLYEDDYDGHSKLVRRVDIQITGDDLFTTNIDRVRQGSLTGAATSVLLKVNQIGTISEALDMVQYAYKLGYGVMPCESRGEGPDIADYCVGINACAVREMATGETGNRFLEIERELGSKARFMGTAGLCGSRFRPRNV